jgi:hypothetical protein
MWLLTGACNPHPSIESKAEINHNEARSFPKCSPNDYKIIDAVIIEQFSDKKYAADLN